jgi:hypothetical protein
MLVCTERLTLLQHSDMHGNIDMDMQLYVCLQGGGVQRDRHARPWVVQREASSMLPQQSMLRPVIKYISSICSAAAARASTANVADQLGHKPLAVDEPVQKRRSYLLHDSKHEHEL